MAISKKGARPRPLAHLDPDACRVLWCAVIAEAWNLAIVPDGDAHSSEVGSAQNWFGSRDFWTVCGLAGADGPAILRAYRAARASGGSAISIYTDAPRGRSGKRARVT